MGLGHGERFFKQLHFKGSRGTRRTCCATQKGAINQCNTTNYLSVWSHEDTKKTPKWHSMSAYKIEPCMMRPESTSKMRLYIQEQITHLRQRSFQLGTWCWFTQTVRAQASAQASSSETPQTVTQVSGVGSFENAPTFFSILLDVQTLSHTNKSSWLLSRPLASFSLCSSARLLFALIACPKPMAGIAAPTRVHHISIIGASTL
ncbi:hypothetical protein H6P81_011012 [Aristolochia fimbriata]|uniref:Uncharacterized protein n=1 Tax=Aristolochia fimbriata TaxID=158543 RepID=A0AAV7ETT1_ARIFI|nr:hypothetical protein H6P81_011012 [Aristolochia fimbriata]